MARELPQITDLKWKTDLAYHARSFIQQKVKTGHNYVTYGDLMDEMGIDRFRLGQVLGILQWIDTMLKTPLHSAFVSYKNGEKIGEPGESFYGCARWLGYEIEDEWKFCMKQRREVRKMLGVKYE